MPPEKSIRRKQGVHFVQSLSLQNLTLYDDVSTLVVIEKNTLLARWLEVHHSWRNPIKQNRGDVGFRWTENQRETKRKSVCRNIETNLALGMFNK